MLSAYLVLCQKDGGFGEICAECGAGTFVTDNAGFLQKAKMALWVARHNNKSKLFLQAERFWTISFLQP
jgi:hypothetical protein